MATTTEAAEAIARLREQITQSGTRTIYSVIRHVTRSRNNWSVDLYYVANNVPHCCTGDVCRALERKFDKDHGGAKIRGSGINPGADLVEALGRVLRLNLTHKSL